MLPYPHIDPVIVHLGPLQLRWYGMMYLVGFCVAWFLGKHRAKTSPIGLTSTDIDDMIFYALIGLILGARIGYMLFYNFDEFIQHPTSIFAIWKGGMSFHGGFIGVLLAMWLFARKLGKSFFAIGDFLVPLAPLGLLAGRMGNFINGELWGRPTTLPWGMVFPDAGDLPRHPSQLYEGFLEGLVLFIVIWTFSAKPRPTKAVSGLFLLLYGCFRFSVELVREPDPQLGFIAFGWLTMGQLLSVPLVLFGALLLWLAYRKKSA